MPPPFSTGLDVVEELIALGRHNRPGTKMTPTTVTIHNTDNTRPGAGAKAHSRFVRTNGRNVVNGKVIPVSWHFTVDDTFIIQHIPINEVAFHAGSNANGSSLAIEICMNPESNEAEANAKAAALAARLIARLGLGIGALRRHQDWTGKACPSRLLTQSKWSSFRAAVQEELQSLGGSAVASGPADDAHVHPTPMVAGHEIDHDALAAVLDGRDEGPGDVALSLGTGAGDLATILRSVIDVLSSLPACDGTRFLFPHGIMEIALTLPTGIALAVKGPDRGTTGPGALERDHIEKQSSGEFAHDHAHDHDDEPCEAPDDQPGEATLSEPISTQLPRSAVAFYTYGEDRKRFGTARTARAIQEIAAAFFEATGARLGVGNLSISGGGPMPPHSSHRRGVDVDLRVPRRDGKELPATFRDASYSRDRTQTLVDIVRENSVMPVRVILFNDDRVNGVRPFSGHDNHLHVSFDPTSASASLEPDDVVSSTRPRRAR